MKKKFISEPIELESGRIVQATGYEFEDSQQLEHFGFHCTLDDSWIEVERASDFETGENFEITGEQQEYLEQNLVVENYL